MGNGQAMVREETVALMKAPEKSERKVDNLLQAIGNTPLVKINSLAAGLKTTIYVKSEYWMYEHGFIE